MGRLTRRSENGESHKHDRQASGIRLKRSDNRSVHISNYRVIRLQYCRLACRLEFAGISNYEALAILYLFYNYFRTRFCCSMAINIHSITRLGFLPLSGETTANRATPIVKERVSRNPVVVHRSL